MSFSLVYLLQRFFYRIWIFLYNWYSGGFRFFSRAAVNFLERLDQFWALKITLINLFEPLYQDRTFLGRILGFCFRTVRILVATSLYLLVAAFFCALYVSWALIPAAIAYYGWR